MQYRIVQTLAETAIGTDWSSTTERLTREVATAIAEGWRPIGGVAVAHPLGGGQPSLLQSMVRGEPASSDLGDPSTGLNRPSSPR